jgi:glycine cleavage system H protein
VGDRIALLVGNSIFDNPKAFPNLRTPANDVREFAHVLEQFGGFKIEDVLLDQNQQVIRAAISDLFGKAKRGDLVLFYYSGHGYKDRSGNHFLVTSDSQPAHNIFHTSVAANHIKLVINGSECRHRVIILDCCFSGAFLDGVKSGEEPLLLQDLKGEATAVLASSGRIQYSFEEKGPNSLFTQYLIRGINTSEAARIGGQIYLEDLYNYTKEKVQEIRPNQTPMLDMSVRESEILIVGRSPTAKGKLPIAIQAALQSEYIDICIGGLNALGKYVADNENEQYKIIAQETLQDLTNNHPEIEVQKRASELLIKLSTLETGITAPEVSFDKYERIHPPDYEFQLPTQLLFSEDDTWIRVEENIAIIGITDYAQDLLSDIVFVEYLLDERDEASRGDSLVAVESIKAAVEVYLPVSGEVVAVNEDLADSPELINSDPYGNGWMFKIKMSDPSEVNDLLDAAGYEALAKDQ